MKRVLLLLMIILSGVLLSAKNKNWDYKKYVHLNSKNVVCYNKDFSYGDLSDEDLHKKLLLWLMDSFWNDEIDIKYENSDYKVLYADIKYGGVRFNARFRYSNGTLSVRVIDIYKLHEKHIDIGNEKLTERYEISLTTSYFMVQDYRVTRKYNLKILKSVNDLITNNFFIHINNLTSGKEMYYCK